MNHKVQTAIKGSVIALALVLAIGCTSIESLETKIGVLEQEVAAAQSGAAAAQRAAESAQATADAALRSANESQACCDATNEKIDRMFQRSQSK